MCNDSSFSHLVRLWTDIATLAPTGCEEGDCAWKILTLRLFTTTSPLHLQSPIMRQVQCEFYITATSIAKLYYRQEHAGQLAIQ